MLVQRDIPWRRAVFLGAGDELVGLVATSKAQNVKGRVKEFGKAVKFAVVSADFGLESPVHRADSRVGIETAFRRGGGGGRGGVSGHKRREAIDASEEVAGPEEMHKVSTLSVVERRLSMVYPVGFDAIRLIFR